MINSHLLSYTSCHRLYSALQVNPVYHFPNPEINSASQRLVNQHVTSHPNEKILMQVYNCNNTVTVYLMPHSVHYHSVTISVLFQYLRSKPNIVTKNSLTGSMGTTTSATLHSILSNVAVDALLFEPHLKDAAQ